MWAYDVKTEYNLLTYFFVNLLTYFFGNLKKIEFLIYKITKTIIKTIIN
jgi:hypothetical protein